MLAARGNLRPVIYSKVRHPVTKALFDSYNNNFNKQSIRDIYLNGTLRKSIDWAYQNEWRLLQPPQKHDQKGFCLEFFPITKLYLGNRMTKDRRKEIIDICKRKGIPYAGIIRAPDRYEMQECKALCENCPKINKAR